MPSTLSKSHERAAAKTARPAPDPKSQNLPPGCRPSFEHLKQPGKRAETNFAVGQRRRHEAMLSPFFPGRALPNMLGVELVELVVEVLLGGGRCRVREALLLEVAAVVPYFIWREAALERVGAVAAHGAVFGQPLDGQRCASVSLR